MRDRVMGIVANAMGLDVLPEGHVLEEDERWDSLAKVMAVSMMVDELGVNVPLDTLAEVSTLDDIIALVDHAGGEER